MKSAVRNLRSAGRKLLGPAVLVTASLIASAAPPVFPSTQPAVDPQRVTPVVLAYRKARPAVVSISAEKVAAVGLFGDDPFEEIFPSPLTRRVPVQSLGSGVVIHPEGYIATNAHVVRKAEKITVTLADKKSYPAKIIVADPDRDLAVLKVEPPGGVPMAYLPLGRSDDLMVGESVIAIGNPMGYASSVTTGVISATDRTLEFSGGVKYGGLIQTDAPINPGNSGGPLLNIKGELIGINTAIRADAQNIGFAIPVDALADELGNLLDFERINRVIFGAAVVQKHGAGGDELVVSVVRKGTPADGQLREGDRVVAVNGRAVKQIPDYSCIMLTAKAGEKVALKAIRDGKEITVQVTLAGKPRPDGKLLAERLFGMVLRPVTPELAKDMRLTVDRGLVVVSIDGGGPADKLGVQVKDVLFQVDRYFVGDLDELGMLLEEVKAGQQIRIGIVRRNVRAWAGITARAAPTTAPAVRTPGGVRA